MHRAFDDGRIEDAEAAFKEYALEEKDPVKLEGNKAFFLYFLFKKGKDNSAITQLENLANTSANEESKYIILTWLSFCLRDSSQIKAEIELWNKAVESFQSDKQVTGATVNLAYALNLDGRSNNAYTDVAQIADSVHPTDTSRVLFQCIQHVFFGISDPKMLNCATTV
jgi:tetratricopeptide (TPR) repeat protein